jgi:hypothetical protein
MSVWSSERFTKNKVLQGTTSGSAGASINIPHGLDGARIVGVTGIVWTATGVGYAPTVSISGYEFNINHTQTDVIISTTLANSLNVLNRPVTITIFYR